MALRLSHLATVTLAVLFGLSISCANKPTIFEENIGKRIDDLCLNSLKCQIRFAELTDFKWESLSVFGMGQSAEDANASLGKNVFSDQNRLVQRMAFFDKDELVRIEIGRPIVEHYLPGSVNISVGKHPGGMAKFDQTSVIDVRIDRGKRSAIYYLKCINCDSK